MAHNLSGRRARRALAELLGAIGPGLTVVVVDARGLVLGDAPGRRGGFEADDERADDWPGLGAAGPDDLAEARRQGAALRRAEDGLLAGGWRVLGVDRPAGDGRGTEHVLSAHGPLGEVLGWVAWRALVAAVAAGTAPDDPPPLPARTGL